MKKRIWELDALRGLCILGMVVVHFVYDLVELYGLIKWEYPPAFLLCSTMGRCAVLADLRYLRYVGFPVYPQRSAGICLRTGGLSRHLWDVLF